MIEIELKWRRALITGGDSSHCDQQLWGYFILSLFPVGATSPGGVGSLRESGIGTAGGDVFPNFRIDFLKNTGSAAPTLAGE